jgi:hypothetical protein
MEERVMVKKQLWAVPIAAGNQRTTWLAFSDHREGAQWSRGLESDSLEAVAGHVPWFWARTSPGRHCSTVKQVQHYIEAIWH